MDWATAGCLVNGVATLSCLPVLFINITHAALLFAGSVALIIILSAGIRYTIFGGDAKQLEQARKVLTYAIFGLLIILFSFLILSIIEKATGVTCISFFSPFSSGNCTGATVQ